MKVTSIIENTSVKGLPVEHGLSLYICLADGRKILFDMGQRHLYTENARRLGLSIAEVDTAVVSHGHYDHGGGLANFLEHNYKARVYIHEDAFLPHYSLRDSGLAYIGIDRNLMSSDRLVICDSFQKIDDAMTVFAGVKGNCCCPAGNRLLYEAPSCSPCSGRLDITKIAGIRHDIFSHEQNLIIEEGDNTVLFAGCAHNGIVNIIRRAEEVIGKKPTHVLAGMHLVKNGLNMEDEDNFITLLAENLMEYDNCRFYTMHCTGMQQYMKLKAIMGNQIEYLSCGDSVTI